MAEEMQVETTLTYSFTHIFVKAPFKAAMDSCFNKFDADEKLTVIEEYLGKQIDFEYYIVFTCKWLFDFDLALLWVLKLNPD